MSKLSNIINFIKDVISPKYCYSCKKEWHFLCPQCLQKIKKHHPFCYLCKEKNTGFETHEKCKKSVFFDKIIVYCHYRDNTIKKLIKDAKFYGRHEILYDLWLCLSTLLFENEKITKKSDYIIASTPMYLIRKLTRGYNHSDVLAKQISEKTSILYYHDMTKKQKNTKQQSKLSKKERENNLINAFELNKKYIEIIKWKNIIIVDDVVSTWTTINEIAKLFKNRWAKKVIWLVIASD